MTEIHDINAQNRQTLKRLKKIPYTDAGNVITKDIPMDN